jgi:hypothetical protein
VYTSAALEKHEFGEGEKELDQHQWCEFCARLFFDKVRNAVLHSTHQRMNECQRPLYINQSRDQDDIFQHLMKEHFTCHLCERNGIKYHYYKDYRSLERHFRRQHFICEDKGCLEKKFIVFGTALDLRVTHLPQHTRRDNHLSRARESLSAHNCVLIFTAGP